MAGGYDNILIIRNWDCQVPLWFRSRVVRCIGSGEAGNSGWEEGDQQSPLRSSYASPGSLTPRHFGTDIDGVILVFVLRELHIFSGIY